MSARAKSMVLGLIGAAMLVPTVACNRDRIEAIELANQAEKDRENNMQSAIAKWGRAVELDPDNHVILYRLAEGYKAQKDWAKVAAICAKAEAAEEKQSKSKTFANYYWLDGVAHKNLALAGQGTYENAKNRLLKAIEIDPNLADAYSELADVLLQMDDEQGALANYSKAIEKKPDRLKYYINLANLYYPQLGYLAEAKQVATEGLSFAKEAKEPKEGSKEDQQGKAEGNVVALHSILGNLSMAESNVAEAVTHYEAAKRVCAADECKGHPDVYYNLGTAYSQANPPDREKAIAELKRFNRVACKSNTKGQEEHCAVAQEIAMRLKGTLN